MHEFLTTKEVASLLRIKERKVYELVGERAIPVSRATGKLLFPRDLVVAWVRRQIDFAEGIGALAPPPCVITGSHDPLLDWAIRESGCDIATLFAGSLDGLERFAAGRCVAAAMHVCEQDGEQWNVALVAERLRAEPVALLEWCKRTQGLVVPRGNPATINGIADLAGKRFVPRQREAGARLLFDQLARADGVDASAIELVQPPARSESDVALYVAEGKADAGLAVESVALQHRLGFVPLVRERFDLLVRRREYFEPPMQRLLTFCRSAAFRARAEELRGYDVSRLGAVHFNGD